MVKVVVVSCFPDCPQILGNQSTPSDVRVERLITYGFPCVEPTGVVHIRESMQKRSGCFELQFSPEVGSIRAPKEDAA